MNWGKGIAILYSGFVILIGGMVYITTQQKFDLVSEDYYNQELKFQDKINAAAQANALQENVVFSLGQTALTIQLSSQLDFKNLTGHILCYKSSDSKQDVTINLKPDENGKQIIPRNTFSHGLYMLKLSFKSDGKDFYVEKEMKF